MEDYPKTPELESQPPSPPLAQPQPQRPQHQQRRPSRPRVMTDEFPIRIKDRIGTPLYIIARIFMLPHFNVFEKTTYRPIVRITRATSAEETRKHVLEWCTRKTNESNYVQVAGAVLFASVVSCLGWETIAETHWLASAAFYVCILLSLASIFTAAQQSIILPELDSLTNNFTPEEFETLRQSFRERVKDGEPHLLTLFAWQCPIMLLGYSVAFFVLGMSTFVVSPWANGPLWGPHAKTAILFFVSVVVIAISASVTTPRVYRFRV